MRIYSSILAICFCALLSANNDPIGAKSAGIGHASVSLSDGWSLFNNQAGLAFLEKPFIGISYENRFQLKELSRNFIGLALPTESGTIGISALSFGNQLYSEAKYGLAYARKLNDKMSLGVQLNYMTTRLPADYGSRKNLSAEVGLMASLSDELQVGVHVFNPTQSELSESVSENIPTVFRIGAQYKVSEKVFIAAETEKDLEREAIFKSGIQYHVLEKLYLRTGISTNPTYSSFGFGMLLEQFIIDFSTSYQPRLGYTPQFSISYDLDKVK